MTGSGVGYTIGAGVGCRNSAPPGVGVKISRQMFSAVGEAVASNVGVGVTNTIVDSVADGAGLLIADRNTQPSTATARPPTSHSNHSPNFGAREDGIKS